MIDTKLATLTLQVGIGFKHRFSVFQQIILQSIMDFIRELWKVRCGYIKAESILTADQIFRQRTKKIHDNNVHMREYIEIIDIHLLEKHEPYFRTSSVDTLEIWETKVKEALKNTINVPESQPTIGEMINSTRREYIIPNEENEDMRTYVKRKAHFCSNMDPVWYKRLKLSFGHNRAQTSTKKLQRKTLRHKFNRLKKHMRRHHIRNDKRTRGRLCVQFNNINSIHNSERS